MAEKEGNEAVIGLSATIRRNARAVHRELADAAGGVVLNLDSGAYYSLNQVGLLIWTLLEGGITFEALVSTLRDRVDDAPTTLEDEVRGFLAELEGRELVTIGA